MKTNNNIPEATELKNINSNKKENESPRLWQSVLVGGIPGIMIGMGASMAYEAMAGNAKAEEQSLADHAEENPSEAENSAETTEASAAATINEATGLNDEMSFKEAFASAREEVGKGGAFVWHGKVYGTYRGDDPEWLAMSDEERAEHSRQILSQVHGKPYTAKEIESENAESEENANELEAVSDKVNELISEEENTETSDFEKSVEEAQVEVNEPELDIHVTGVSMAGTEDGAIMTKGIGEVSGSYAEFMDMDCDGEIETVLIDSNNDGQISIDEVFDTTGEGITVNEMIETAVQDQLADAIEDLGDSDVELI